MDEVIIAFRDQRSLTECFTLYLKGLVVVGEDGKKLGAIGVAIFDSANAVVAKASKPLVLPVEEMTDEVAHLEAFVYGLQLALSLNLRKVVYSCVGFNVDPFVKRERKNKKLRFVRDLVLRCHKPIANQKPKDTKVAKLVDSVARLKKRFGSCHSSAATKNNAQFVFHLSRSSIAKQAGKPVEEIAVITEKCPICLEDVNSKKMFEIHSCHHRFCSSCMQMHVQLNVRGRKLPRCPHPNCRLALSIDACKKFLAQEMYDILDHLVKESSIPATMKVYCPNPRCSYLMSKTEALQTNRSLVWTNTADLTACRCVKCHTIFCIQCKVVWHTGMPCDVYKKHNLYLRSADAKVNVLAGNKKWRQCTKCSHMVELAHGCNHIYCRCGHEFCYVCGREWKNKKATCSCPLWAEENIIRHGGVH